MKHYIGHRLFIITTSQKSSILILLGKGFHETFFVVFSLSVFFAYRFRCLLTGGVPTCPCPSQELLRPSVLASRPKERQRDVRTQVANGKGMVTPKGKDGLPTIQEFSNIPLEHTPDPQPTVYEGILFIWGFGDAWGILQGYVGVYSASG